MSGNNSTALPTILDIEASGFGKGSYPIEVGLIRSDGKSFCTLIKPAAEWAEWNDDAEKVHGVSRQVLQDKGRPIQDVAEQLNELLAGTTVYTDAWGQDYTWLSLLHEAASVPMEYRVESLSVLLTECQKSVWHGTRDRVEQVLGLQRHRASSDARVIQMTYHWSSNSEACQSAHAAIGAA